MAEQLLHCAGCNANFKSKSYDPNKTYPCPKCKQPLALKGEADTSATGVALDTEGKIQTNQAGDALVGRKIAQYKVAKKLGQGGMGAVYEAKHLELGRTVALKLLSPKLVEEDPDSVERFKREARSAAVLNHPNVVAIHYVGSEGPHHFIEQEFVDGESVHERVTREGKLDLAEATRIVADAAEALGAAHKQNIVHRDIKPGNIMLSEDGQVKVMDFGLAKDVAAPTQLTVSGHIMGTPHYMSPEQCDGQPLDGRSDIYALGATYYAILAGKTPYQGTSLFSVLRQQVESPVPDVRAKCPELPEGVQRVIEKAMAKAPEDRFQTAEELVAALGQVGSAPSGLAATVSTPAPASGSATVGATLDDVMDADEERESHLHTARIRGRIKEVEAFLGVWKELAKTAAASRKKGQASEAEEAEFAKLRDTIRKQYTGILRRLGNPGAPGQRVVSACETGVTLSSIAQMADADFRDLSSHFQTGAKLLFDYVAFLEDGRQDLLKQSTFYFYWDKVMHNPMAAAIAGLAALMLLSIIVWQVVTRLPEGKATPVARGAAPEVAATENETSDEGPADTVTPANPADTETPAEAPPEPLANAIVVKQDGTGDFTDLARAIEAAKPEQTIEIADSGRYSIAVECTVPCALRGSPARRPTIVLAKKARLTFQPGSRLENVTLEGERHAFAYGGSFEHVRFATPGGLSFHPLPDSKKEQMLSIRNCLFTVPGRVVYCLGSPQNRPVKILFEHNTVMGAPFWITGQAVLMEAKGNVFLMRTLVSCEPKGAKPEAGCGKCTFIGTRNCYCGVSQFMVSRGATAEEKFEVKSLKAWQAKTGTDVDSFEADPKLVDVAGGKLRFVPDSSFRLAPDSPCRGKGPEGRDIGIQWDEWDGAKTHDAATQPESRTDHRLERAQGTSLEPVKSLVAKNAGFEGDKRYPRVIRLSNGHLLMAFDPYQPPGKPSSIIDAKIACVRSEDNGKTWAEPTIIADTEDDDRCGVLAEADDGTVLCHFYSHRPQTNWVRLRMAVSNDYGKTWSLATQWLSGGPLRACTNSPAIKLANGTLILPIYTVAQSKQKLYRPAVIRPQDHGKTWGDMSVIDADTGHRHCEPALVVLPDGRWLCLMRPCMCRCYSSDQGRTWTKPERVGFRGDCPCLLRTSTGVILCAHRHPGTSLSYSLDNGAHWVGPVTMDRYRGAYPSMVELPDGPILCVFRCGHDTSAVWSVRFRATDRGITWLAR